MEASLSDRRRAPRRGSVQEHGVVNTRVRPGHTVELKDISAGGALVDGVRRLLPGTQVDLLLSCGDRSATVRGRVLRCTVIGLSPTSVCYRGAIGFDRELPWFLNPEASGYPVPVEKPPPLEQREVATQPTL
jgi:hypothetical protein